MTMAYVSVLKPNWFPLQAAVTVSDYLLSIMMDTYRGMSPDVETLTGNWASASLHWAS